VWSNNRASAQAAFDGMATAAEASNRNNVLSVIDFLQGMVESYQLPIVKPTVGMLHSATLHIVKDQEVNHNVPRRTTEANLLRKGQREALLERFKTVFPDRGAAELILSICEQVTLVIFHKVATEKQSDDIYMKALMDLVKPTVTQVAASHFQKQNFTTAAVPADRRKGIAAQPKRTYTSVYQPVIRVNDKIIQFLAADEKVVYKQASVAVATAGKATSLAYCDAPEIGLRCAKVEAYVKATYSVQYVCDDLVKERRELVRTRCFEKARDYAIRQNLPKRSDGKLDLSHWDDALWQSCLKEVIAEKSGASCSSLFTLMRTLLLKSAEQNLDPGADVPEYIKSRVALVTEATFE